MNVGFVGLGAMGQLIVPRLMAAGHLVTGWNRSKEKAEALINLGMRWADTPRAVAEQSELVFSIVTDSRAVRAVALGPDGVISGLRRGGVYIDMSTIEPDESRAVAEQSELVFSIVTDSKAVRAVALPFLSGLSRQVSLVWNRKVAEVRPAIARYSRLLPSMFRMQGR